ncbi:hypothetical protein [Snodgrassella alvi]|uniref:hypothetical protein n=1 Tax=Snodgrassella alvi TaxID=1196083 RepID=UPI0035174547
MSMNSSRVAAGWVFCRRNQATQDKPENSCWRKTSYSTMATALERLSERECSDCVKIKHFIYCSY